MRLATADGETLTTALRQMSAAPRKLSGSAFWYFNRDQLVIKWTSYEQPVDIRDGTPLAGAIVVLGRAMNQLGAMMDLKGEIEIHWDRDRDRLRIGIHSVPASHMQRRPPFELPLDAREKDLLKQRLRWGQEQVSLAGYAEEIDEVEARWEKSIETAATSLAWTGLSKEKLRAVLSEVLGNDIKQSE